MLDVLEVQDKLKNFSQEQLLREMQMPTGSVPQFLVLSELNRRRTMSQDMEKQKMADQPTVKEEVVAASGMPMPETSMLAQQMAPQTSMSENTGIAAMMPKELPSEEEPMKMSFGGLLMGSRMLNEMAAPLASRITPRPGLGTRQVTDMEYRPLPNERLNLPQIARQGYSGGLGGLGSDIMSRVSDKSRGDVDNFLGEVEGMAEERFDIDLAPQQRQIGIGGKGQLTRRAMPAMPFAMNEGGPIKAQGGMFADISGAIGSADAPSFSMPPAFASIYNYAKTVLGLDDELARDVANKTIEQGNIDKSQLGMFSAKPFGSVEERLSGDDRLAQRKALDTFTGGAEMNRLVDQLSKPQAQDGKTEVQDVEGVADLDLTQVNPLFSAKPFGTVDQRMSGVNNALAQRKALDNFTGGAEMSDLVNRLGKSQKVLPENPYADDIKQMTDMGVGSSVASMDKGFKAVGDYLMEDKFADVRQAEDAERTRKALEVFSGGKEMDDLVNRMQNEEKMKEAFRFGRGSPFKAEEAERTKQAFENFTGGEEMDKLVDKMQTDKTKKTDSDSAGALGGFGATSGALSELEAEIDKLRADRKKGRESDKWFALAEVGLGMLASQSPTLAGALGEGGLRGLKSFREGKKEYDKDMLGYLTTKASIQKTRGELGLKSQLYKKQIEALKNKGASGTYGIKEAKDDLNNTNQRIAKLLELSTDPQRQIGSDSESKAEIDRQLKNLLAEKAAAEVYLRSIGANVPFSFTGNQTTVPNLADE
mgnify:CR=1 FL=1